MRVLQWVVGLLAVVSVVVGFLVFNPFSANAGGGGTSAQPIDVHATVADLKAQAERNHPGMSQSDALRMEATQLAVNKLDGQSSQQKTWTAATMFFGFYEANTRARKEYCAQRGIDLSPFVNAFTRRHQDELLRANMIYAAAGKSPEPALQMLRNEMSAMIDQDMRDSAQAVGVSANKACELFNERAEQMAQVLALPPAVQQALMAN